MEQSFQDAWQEVTRQLIRERGGRGSRLHRSSDGEWIAYAQWPSRQIWEASRALGAVDPIASKALQASIEETKEPLLLDLVSDMLLS